MKFIQSIFALGAASVLLASCNKKDVETYMNTTTVPGSGNANVKIVHASAFTTNYSVQLKLNGERVSNNITYSTPFPGGGLNTGGSNYPWYMSVPAGESRITLSVPKAGTNTDSIVLYTGYAYMQSELYYTVFISDTGNNARLTKNQETILMPIDGTCRFKFINLMPNLAAADLYAGVNKVASNIAYGSFSPEFTLNKNDTVHWYVRAAGALPTTAPVASYPTTSTPQTIPNQRVFTVYSRGYAGATSNRAPAVSLTYN